MKGFVQDIEDIAYCQSGQRSYNAAHILGQHGCRVRNLTGSYRTWRAACIEEPQGEPTAESKFPNGQTVQQNNL